MKNNKEINIITDQFINLYNPQKLILFGSYAKNKATKKSDIDLCVITETQNKRNLLTDMYLKIDCEKPFDLVLYTPEEWRNTLSDNLSFAHIINKEGVVLYARQHEI